MYSMETMHNDVKVKRVDRVGTFILCAQEIMN